MNIKRFLKYPRITLILLLATLLPVLLIVFSENILEWYIVSSAEHLVKLENEGRLSREYGYVWYEINQHKKMTRVSRGFARDTVDSIDSPPRDISKAFTAPIEANMPSISALEELNKIREYAHVILVTDRNDRLLGEIRTTHKRIKPEELSEVLLKAIIFSEDKHFFSRELAYEYRAFVRALVSALFRTIKSGSLSYPRGTSTIHQQVARFLLSKFDSRGFIFIEKSLRRKLRELKLAQALKMRYTNKEILEIYLNHCITAGDGMVGFHDISKGLFNKLPSDLDICQSLYLSRLVKWNRNMPRRIKRQVKIEMKRTGSFLDWNKSKQDSILSALDSLTFFKPKRIVSAHNPLIDLANEYWLSICRLNDMDSSQVADMDISRPNSLIRRKGNLKIQLHVDLRLQRRLEQLVNGRGFGRDTTICTDIRIGSFGVDLRLKNMPPDTLRKVTIVKKDTFFSEPGSSYRAALTRGDTLITNIRHRRRAPGLVRKSIYYYRRDSTRVPGQYFSYAMMNSKTGELLAYYSKDKIGSRLSSLVRNKTPNGSAVAKPLIFALNYDMGTWGPYSMITDSLECPRDYPWARTFHEEGGIKNGMVYHNSSVVDGYLVQNHNKRFEGYDYVFKHLARSNNIIGVEAIYRLGHYLLDKERMLSERGRYVSALLDRMAASRQAREKLSAGKMTGPLLYAELARLSGVDADSVIEKGRRIPFPSDYYSVALGTLELTLYQQMHLFNILYNNEIITEPAKHPRLVIKSVSISGKSIEYQDELEKRTVFKDPVALHPVHLALHRRLTGNPYDGLGEYDLEADSVFLASIDRGPEFLPSNFAKSGTTDDIIRPYDKDIVSKEATNYGLWNAVLRLRLERENFESIPESLLGFNGAPDFDSMNVPEKETLDVTLACVGECNERTTGPRDGKSLHKYTSIGLLKAFGLKTGPGIYKRLYQHFVEDTPDSMKFGNPYEGPSLSVEALRRIQKKTPVRKLQTIEKMHFSKKFLLGFRLDKKSYLRLLSYSPYLGANADKYLRLVEKLKACKKPKEARKILREIRSIEIKSRFMKPEMERVLQVLSKNLRSFE